MPEEDGVRLEVEVAHGEEGHEERASSLSDRGSGRCPIAGEDVPCEDGGETQDGISAVESAGRSASEVAALEGPPPVAERVDAMSCASSMKIFNSDAGSGMGAARGSAASHDAIFRTMPDGSGSRVSSRYPSAAAVGKAIPMPPPAPADAGTPGVSLLVGSAQGCGVAPGAVDSVFASVPPSDVASQSSLHPLTGAHEPTVPRPSLTAPRGRKTFAVDHAGRVQEFQVSVGEAAENVQASIRASFGLPPVADVTLLLAGSSVGVAVGWESLVDGEAYTLRTTAAAQPPAPARDPPSRVSPAAPDAQVTTPYALATPGLPFSTVEAVVRERRSDGGRREVWGAPRTRSPPPPADPSAVDAGVVPRTLRPQPTPKQPSALPHEPPNPFRMAPPSEAHGASPGDLYPHTHTHTHTKPAPEDRLHDPSGLEAAKWRWRMHGSPLPHPQQRPRDYTPVAPPPAPSRADPTPAGGVAVVPDPRSSSAASSGRPAAQVCHAVRLPALGEYPNLQSWLEGGRTAFQRNVSTVWNSAQHSVHEPQPRVCTVRTPPREREESVEIVVSPLPVAAATQRFQRARAAEGGGAERRSAPRFAVSASPGADGKQSVGHEPAPALAPPQLPARPVPRREDSAAAQRSRTHYSGAALDIWNGHREGADSRGGTPVPEVPPPHVLYAARQAPTPGAAATVAPQPTMHALLIGVDRSGMGGGTAALALRSYLDDAYPPHERRITVLTECAGATPPTRCNIIDGLQALANAFPSDTADTAARAVLHDAAMFVTSKRRIFAFAGATVPNPAARAAMTEECLRPGAAGFSQALVPFDGKGQCISDDFLFSWLLDPARAAPDGDVTTVLVFDTDRPVLTMPYTIRYEADGSIISQEREGLPFMLPGVLVVSVQYIFTSAACTALPRTGYVLQALVEILRATPRLTCVQLLTALRGVLRDRLPPTVVPLPVLGCSRRCSLADQEFRL
eukprot:TRINITY_DN5480_c0_g1_i1.p1 TRINITY_DN5480_c0_g1~~TRINITY_DN5480_c0_g1_i1.p1  ORF type:complete len:964 (+),score=80.03 TRINITY_DN5480_c0_g1_i1:55-2946(+)